MLVFEVVGFGVAFAFVWAGVFALTGLGVGAGGPFLPYVVLQINCISYNSL